MVLCFILTPSFDASKGFASTKKLSSNNTNDVMFSQTGHEQENALGSPIGFLDNFRTGMRVWGFSGTTEPCTIEPSTTACLKLLHASFT